MTVTTPDDAESRDVESDGGPPSPFHLESYAHLLNKAPHQAGIGTERGDRTQDTPVPVPSSTRSSSRPSAPRSSSVRRYGSPISYAAN